jgi:hypothetical protein
MQWYIIDTIRKKIIESQESWWQSVGIWRLMKNEENENENLYG